MWQRDTLLRIHFFTENAVACALIMLITIMDFESMYKFCHNILYVFWNREQLHLA